MHKKFLTIVSTQRHSLWPTALVMGIGIIIMVCITYVHANAADIKQKSYASPEDVAHPAPFVQSNLRGTRTTKLSASTTHKGQPLTSEAVWTVVGGRSASVRFYQRIELGGVLLRELTYVQTPGSKRSSQGNKVTTAMSMGRIEIFNGPAIRGPRHIILKNENGLLKGIADGRILTKEELHNVSSFSDPELSNSMRALVANAHRNLQTGQKGVRRPMESNACDNCDNDCDDKAKSCGVDSFTSLDPVELFGCYKTWYDCRNNCNNPGGPCCNVNCGNGTCCATGQSCCGGSGGTPPTCCDNGSVCVSGIFQGVTQYSYCCPGGSDAAGCQYTDDGFNITMYCRQPNQTCCGYEGVCNSGQFCANAEWGICCSSGQDYCANSLTCCNGKCITYNRGTSAEHQECCTNPNVIWGDPNSAGNSTCCAPANRRTASSGKHVCCDHPLCGDVCCESPAICQNGKCGIGTPCGNTYCGFGEQCCGGKCCNGTCLNGKSCCPNTQQACGNACCPPGQLCVNAKSSTCAAATHPTLLIYSTANGELLGHSGGQPIRYVSGGSMLVKGQSFSPGSVVLSVDTPGGARIATPTADAKGAFSVTISTSKFPGGSHKLVASQGSVSTSISLTVEFIQ